MLGIVDEKGERCFCIIVPFSGVVEQMELFTIIGFCQL